MQTPTTWAERTGLTERLLDIGIAVFLWAFRIIVLFVVVVGSLLTLARGRYSIEVWIDLIVGGLSLGAIYALIALGYTMVYGILRMINFAHGEIFMVGAFAGFFTGVYLAGTGLLTASPLSAVVGIAIMILMAMAVAALVALIAERIAYRPLRNAPRLVLLISAIGVSFFLQYTVRGLFGPGIYAYPSVPFLAEPVDLPLLSILRLKWLDVLVIGSAIGMMLALYLFVMRSRAGTAIRAVSEDKATAALMGIDVNRAIVTTFAIGAAMAGAAGVLYGLMFRQIFFFSGFVPGIKAFTAAVLGGIGNIPGAMVGGFLLGELESVGPTLFLDGLGVPSPNQLKDVIAFTILVLVLIFRPQGIMGERLSRSRA
ncbi:MAG: branched-chain amino acid ABC transporter permease [Chloroflexi bacterium]|nr:branched-chain amino acid ABC transporter permease [Chloroflexota bacterium]